MGDTYRGSSRIGRFFHWLGLGSFLALLGLTDVLLDELCSLLAQSFIRAEFVLKGGVLLFGDFEIGIGLNIIEAFLLKKLNSCLQSDVELFCYFV